MARNPNHMDNLKPFKKGHDERRNLEGRPPVLPDLNAILAKVLSEEKNGKIALQKLIESMYAEGCSGNTPAAKLLLERGYGMVKQETDVNLKATGVKWIEEREVKPESGE
jgi:hypothetical protein